MKTIKLGELCDINPKDALPDKGTLVSFIPMQRVSETGQVDATEIRQSEEVTKGFSSFREGDILMAKITPCMENGKGGIAKGLCNGIGYGSTEFHVIRPTSPLVRTEWIYYYTTYPRFRKLCEQNMTGSAGQKRVPKSYLLGCPIPVPNLNTQDKVIHSLRSLRSIIELLRAQLMKLEELVKCRFVEMFGYIELNYRLEDLCSLITDGTHQPPQFTDSGIPFLLVSNIKENYINYETYKFIDEQTYRHLIKRTPVETGDLLLSTVGSYGHPAIVQGTQRFCFQRHIAFLKPIRERVNSVYLHQAILSDNVQEQIEKSVLGVAQKTLNLSAIRRLVIPYPPIEKQNSFASFVQRVDKLRIAVQASLDKTQQLFDSLMQEYFG